MAWPPQSAARILSRLGRSGWLLLRQWCASHACGVRADTPASRAPIVSTPPELATACHGLDSSTNEGRWRNASNRLNPGAREEGGRRRGQSRGWRLTLSASLGLLSPDRLKDEPLSSLAPPPTLALLQAHPPGSPCPQDACTTVDAMGCKHNHVVCSLHRSGRNLKGWPTTDGCRPASEYTPS
eukprot:1923293-Rhodomonas_salina.1